MKKQLKSKNVTRKEIEIFYVDKIVTWQSLIGLLLIALLPYSLKIVGLVLAAFPSAFFLGYGIEGWVSHRKREFKNK